MVSGYQRAVGNRETEHLLSQVGDATPLNIQDVARRGMEGAAQPLPHSEAIQRAFGGHEGRQIPAYVGGSAAIAARTMGTVAYEADGGVAFRRPPDLHTAAHEAAHAIQRRWGSGANDQAQNERDADAIADRVVNGQSAEDLLPSTGWGPAPVQAQAPAAVQMYHRLPLGEPYDLVSDDGKMAVKDHSREAWAESKSIEESNKILAEKKSKARIQTIPDGSVTVAAPDVVAQGISYRSLTKFRMVDVQTGKELALRDDCGYASQQMLGAEATGQYTDWAFAALYKGGVTKRSNYIEDDKAPGGNLSTTEQMSGEIYARIFESETKKKHTREEALAAWASLDVAHQRALAEKYGINEFAVPRVGQGITVGTEYDMPGAAKGNGPYPFHFGFNALASGQDYITVESYAQSITPYYFDMYGPESKGQSWHQDPGNVNALGHKRTTMVVDHATEFEGKTNAFGAHFVDDPAVYKTDRVLEKGTEVTVIRKRVNWMKVEVKSGKYMGKTGWILNKYFVGAK